MNVLKLPLALVLSLSMLPAAFVAASELAPGSGSAGPTVDISSTLEAPPEGSQLVAPGDQLVSTMTVSNDGAAAVRYAVTSTTSEDRLASQLELTIWVAEGADAEAGCTAPAAGAVLYGPAELGSTDGIAVIGDPAWGEQTGDRALAPGASEVLCFRVAMPLSTGNAFQDLATTPSFTVTAEEAADNS